jgi:hypothetical protein
VCVHAVEPKRHTCHRCIFPVLSVCVTLKSVHHRPQPHPPPTHPLPPQLSRTHATCTVDFHLPRTSFKPHPFVLMHSGLLLDGARKHSPSLVRQEQLPRSWQQEWRGWWQPRRV